MKDFAEFAHEQRITYRGNSYNHPISVKVSPVEIEGELMQIKIQKEGENTKAYTCSPLVSGLIGKGRGVEIEIEFLSEDGYLWSMELQFHKGETFITTEKLHKAAPRVMAEKVIWRD